MKVIYPSPEFNAKLDALMVAVNAKLADYNGKNFPNLPCPIVSADPGFRYVKLVREDSSKSVYGFVDKVDGAIYMAAGWKKPALNGARGNINDADFGFSACGPYGVVYKGVSGASRW